MGDIGGYGARLIDDLPEQFKGAERLEALMSVVGRQMDDLYSFYGQLCTQRSLSTAEGAQLDAIGDILCLTRKQASSLNGRDSDHEIDDTDYRAMLGYKIMLNYGDATYYDIVRGVKNFCNTYPIRYSESPEHPAAFTLELEVLEGAHVILRNLLPVRAAGVNCSYQFRMGAYIEASSLPDTYGYTVRECGTVTCGTRPSNATVGASGTTHVSVPAGQYGTAYATRYSGTVPDVATAGFSGTYAVSVDASDDTGCYTAGFTGMCESGTLPGQSTAGIEASADAYAGTSAEAYNVTVQPCGAKYCGV